MNNSQLEIGNKKIDFYLFKIFNLLENSNKIDLLTKGQNLRKVNRIINITFQLGLHKDKPRTINKKRIITISLEKIGLGIMNNLDAHLKFLKEKNLNTSNYYHNINKYIKWKTKNGR
jgi:hypothetical protein|tara:strand:- start:498 stop:848 length:351 start_codon:yes stop_codon:yes gene_type:complete